MAFTLHGLAPLRPPAAPLPDDDRPAPEWLVSTLREAVDLLSPLDPSPTAVDAVRRLLEQALRDIAS